jgi:hypothetical protein
MNEPREQSFRPGSKRSAQRSGAATRGTAAFAVAPISPQKLYFTVAPIVRGVPTEAV